MHRYRCSIVEHERTRHWSSITGSRLSQNQHSSTAHLLAIVLACMCEVSLGPRHSRLTLRSGRPFYVLPYPESCGTLTVCSCHFDPVKLLEHLPFLAFYPDCACCMIDPRRPRTIDLQTIIPLLSIAAEPLAFFSQNFPVHDMYEGRRQLTYAFVHDRPSNLEMESRLVYELL